MSTNDEEEPLMINGTTFGYIQEKSDEHKKETKVYRVRFYILAAATLLGFSQGWIWNTFGPIQGPAELVFNWSDSTIALMANWGPIAYIVSVVFFSWIMDVKGLRWAMVITGALVAGGAGIRCISMEPVKATWLNHVGLFLNGLAGPVAMSAPPLISAVWFPPGQRTTATAVTALSAYYGLSFSFVIGPILVPYKKFNGTLNGTVISHNHSANHSEHNVTTNLHTLRENIRLYTFVEFAVAAGAFLLVLIYFPKKPPSPPSITAGCQRTSFVKGLQQLSRRKQFWLVCIAYGICTGTFSGWGAILDVNLKHFGIDEAEAGWIGFYSNVAGSVAGLLFSGIADYLKRRTKVVLILILFGATASFSWFLLICLKVLPFPTACLYISATLGGLFINGAIPLFYELAVESTYPIAEGTTTGILTMMNNLGCLIFLLMPMFRELKNSMDKWMNPAMAAACSVCIPIMLLFRAQYQRLLIDLSGSRDTS
ncbi:solute carrier family 49 member 4 homolog [Corticium candelabrum]|uniref:solute carrier family 49 member 4 homolog n=1 Tax=Corticium candelabrum TaxID=121492 RepID=UPI002E260981|nr:solute carrier family 49 member 4 homolog [Corticium candelabrum]